MQKQAGYSIIEIVIGLFLIAVVFILYEASANTVVLNKNAKHQELALRIAQSEMADLRDLPYTSLPASGTFSSSLLSSLPSGQANLTISDYNSYTKQVVVTVSWKESGNPKTRTVNLTTLITRGGI